MPNENRDEHQQPTIGVDIGQNVQLVHLQKFLLFNVVPVEQTNMLVFTLNKF